MVPIPHRVAVPTLRDVARAAPYFHDGSVASLEQAVRLMARHRLGLELPPADVRRLAAFPRSLGLSIVVEGVESPGQMESLAQLQGDGGIQVQGYRFSRPLPAAALARFSADYASRAAA